MPLKIAMIGTDSSHVVSFSRMLNDADHPFHVKGGQVTQVVRHSSPDFELSYSRESKFSQILIDELNINVVSIDEFAQDTDAIMIESADGREHLSLFKQVVQYGKPVFIDKPLAIGVDDAQAIVDLAVKHHIPIMSSSSLRYSMVLKKHLAQIDKSTIKQVIVKCPLNIEATQSRYYWYVVHGVEILYSVLGQGCKKVASKYDEHGDNLIGIWDNDIVGEVHCILDSNQHFEVTIVTEQETYDISLHDNEHEIPYYASLVEQVVKFFEQKQPLIAYTEMLEVIWFIDQAERLYVNHTVND